jgi:hypothetical protein
MTRQLALLEPSINTQSQEGRDLTLVPQHRKTYPTMHPCHAAKALLKASRPLICVLVINDNHCGLTFLLKYKNRLV